MLKHQEDCGREETLPHNPLESELFKSLASRFARSSTSKLAKSSASKRLIHLLMVGRDTRKNRLMLVLLQP
jgi:hypothetical protein